MKPRSLTLIILIWGYFEPKLPRSLRYIYSHLIASINLLIIPLCDSFVKMEARAILILIILVAMASRKKTVYHPWFIDKFVHSVNITACFLDIRIS